MLGECCQSMDSEATIGLHRFSGGLDHRPRRSDDDDDDDDDDSAHYSPAYPPCICPAFPQYPPGYTKPILGPSGGRAGLYCNALC